MTGTAASVDWLASDADAQENASFRMIDNALSPQGLSQLLGTSYAVQKNVVSDEVTKMLAEKLQKLDAESLSKLGDIAKKFASNGSRNDLTRAAEQFQELLKNDREFRSSMESLAQNMRDKGVDFNDKPSGLDGKSRFNPEDLQRGMIDNELRQQIEERIKEFSRSDIPINDVDSLRNGLAGIPSPNFSNRKGSNPFSPGTSPSSSPNDPSFSSPPNRGARTPSGIPPSRNPNGDQLEPSGSPGSTPRVGRGSGNPNSQNPRPNSGRPDVFGQRPNSTFSDPSSPSSPSSSFSTDPSRNGGNSTPSEFSSPKRSSAGASEQSALPKENVGRKFNRILMKSISNAVEKKLGDESATGLNASADGTKSSFDKLMSKLIDKLRDNNASESALSSASGSVNGNENSGNRSSGQTKRSPSPWKLSGPAASGGGMGLPDVSARGVIYSMVIAAATMAFIVFVLRQTKLGSILGFESPEKKIQTPPKYSQSFSHQGEIVTSIDKLALWLFGSKAEWWNSKIVNHEFSNNRPELTDEINKVMTVYDMARYAPDDQAVTPKVATEVRSTLVKLADPAYIDQQANE